MVATQTSVEMLRFQPETPRAAAHFAALMQTAERAGVQAQQTDVFCGNSDWLLLWGPGGPGRQTVMDRQRAAGGHAIVLDLAYWHREHKARVSIDAPHPQAWVMTRDWPRDRFLGDRVPVASAWNPAGPVVVAGIGRKARAQYGSDTAFEWERAMVDACRAQGRTKIYYRKKQADAPTPQGLPLMNPAQPIDQALAGASLVVTWHSNVAVDAIRMGIPVVCKDGAAAAVCPSTLPAEPRPLPEDLRGRFLSNLAWFQWNPATEASAMWGWLREVLS